MQQTLMQIAGDRSQTQEDRELARDLLELLPELRSLRERGYGELVVKLQDGVVVSVEETRKRQVRRN